MAVSTEGRTVVRGAGPRDELEGACRWLVDLHAEGHAWRDLMLVVPGKRKWRDPLVRVLDDLAIPHRLLVAHPGAEPDFADDLVHAVSLYTAEHVARPVIAVVGLGDLPWKQQGLDEALRVVTEVAAGAGAHLRLSWSKDSALTDRLFTSPGSDARRPG